MRVFVAGATGIAGRRAVLRLIEAGHQVTGVARSAEKAAELADAGASAARVSLFDRSDLFSAVAGHDAVVNLATHIPSPAQMARMSAWKENERIRREGSANLVDAAIAAGADVYVQESLAFLYGEHGDEWVDAASTPLIDARFAGAINEAERSAARFTEHGGRGVVLRFGRFYAPESAQTEMVLQGARRGILMDVGRSNSYVSMIDADDVATAVVAALDAPAGTYDVVDDEPLTRAEHSAALALAMGRRSLRHAPSWAVPQSADFVAASQRVSNERFKVVTGWRPRSPSVRSGYPKMARAAGMEPALAGWVRLLLWLLALTGLAVGVQAAFTPRSFYTDFPFGRGWVAMDGRYNQHLIRDVGALNLALAVVTLGALWIGTRAVAKLAAAGWLVYSVPHWVYHLRHLSMPMSGGEKVAVMVSLSLPIAASVAVLCAPRRSLASARSVPDGKPADLTRMSARR